MTPTENAKIHSILDIKYTWYESLWFSIKHYLWYKPRDIVRGILHFFFNIRIFRKHLIKYEPWDYGFAVELMAFCLDNTADYLEKYGIEVDSMRLKKVAAIKEVASLVRKAWGDESVIEEEACANVFPDYAEWKKQCEDRNACMYVFGNGYDIKEYTKWRDEVDRLYNEYADRIAYLLKGQDSRDYDKVNGDKKPEDDGYVDYADWFDGSGVRGWWD